MTKRLGIATVLAEHFGTDVESIREHRYHRGHTGTLQVFTLDGGYMTACKGNAKPPKVEGYGYKWKKIDSWVTQVFKWTIYYAEESEE